SLIRKRDARPVVGCVGEEAELASVVRPIVRSGPRGRFRDLDIIHVLRRARAFVPGTVEDRGQNAERIVERLLGDGCGAGNGFRLPGACAVYALGNGSVQKQYVGASVVLQSQYAQRLRGRGLHSSCGIVALRYVMPPVRLAN